MRSVSTHRRVELHSGWQLAVVAPSTVEGPASLEGAAIEWRAAEVPGTVASALGAAAERIDLDAHDVWYRARFAADPKKQGEKYVLVLEGLATIADVFVNGEHVLHAESMFEAHEIDVGHVLREANEIHLRFHALGPLLAKRRPRPRWRTALVQSQNLRWFRTTLLGRVVWGPQAKVVGPWRPIAMETRRTIDRPRVDLKTSAQGKVSIACELAALEGVRIDEVTLVVGDSRARLERDEVPIFRGDLQLENPALWWPATHGEPALHRARVEVKTSEGVVEVDCGSIGLRAIDLVTEGGAFTLRVNGVDVFCRGACWTPLDAVKLSTSPERMRAALERARDAGMNMLRVVGPAVYEDDHFYDLCDELGIMVWQDFMFANLDYPLADEAFGAMAKREVRDVCHRLQTHPSVVVMCGNSDVQQQAAMAGAPRAQWIDRVFAEDFREIVKSSRDDVAYVASTPSGGDVPFHVGQGVSAYYGVGAYLRPLEDARRAHVRFTTECLGFSNVPSERAVDAMFGDAAVTTRDPIWQSGVPRDRGAGWDFEDVRDHYLRVLFDLDPMRVRYADVRRYLALGRATTGEVMRRTLSEWRRARSSCKGALVWFLNDMRAGAGFGLVDAWGAPKQPFFSVKRACAPIAVLLSDEGVDGLAVHVVNDRPEPIEGELHVTAYREGRVKTVGGTKKVRVEGRSQIEIVASSFFETFVDLTYAYRFGPPSHDVVTARLVVDGKTIADDFYFPLGLPSHPRGDVALQAIATRTSESSFDVTLQSASLAPFVTLDAPDFEPSDDGFHLEPSVARVITLRAKTPQNKLNAHVQTLGSDARVKIVEAEATR